MAQPARFTFDLDLGKRTTPMAPPEPTMPERLVAELLAQAREEAYAEGVAAGERNATSIAAQTLAAAAATLATQSAEMAAALDTAAEQAQREAVELAASICRKLALLLLASHHSDDLDALLPDDTPSRTDLQQLVVALYPHIARGHPKHPTAHPQNP